MFVGLQSQGKPPLGSQEVACAIDEFEAQGAYGFEGPSVGVFSGAIAFCQPGFNLEARLSFQAFCRTIGLSE